MSHCIANHSPRSPCSRGDNRAIRQKYVLALGRRSRAVATANAAAGVCARSGSALRRLTQDLRVGQRLQLFQRAALDLAHALARDVERAADLLERARAAARDAVAHLDHLALAVR